MTPGEKVFLCVFALILAAAAFDIWREQRRKRDRRRTGRRP